MIERAVLNNQNEILLEVRYRSDALYTPNRLSTEFPNPEPRSYILNNDNFDPLAYALSKAHKAGLKVQAWVVVFNATPVDKERIKQNHIYNNHYDWISYNSNGEKMLNTDQFGYYIDPAIPEVQDYLLNVFADIVRGYPDLDGLHLDYIRYPSVSMGFHPISLQRFETAKKTNPDLSWNQWRIDNVSSFVSRVNTKIKTVNPGIILSAAVIANYQDAVNLYAQAWETWLQDGIIDRVYPMLYNVDNSLFDRHLNRMLKMPHQEKIIVGLRAWNANGSSLAVTNHGKKNTYSILDLKHKIEKVRNAGFNGLALFSYESIILEDAFEHLSRMVFPAEPKQYIAQQPESTIYDAGFSPSHESTDLQYSLSPLPSLSLAVPTIHIGIKGSKDTYTISLNLPEEGRWKWEIVDKGSGVIYQRYRYYLKGENEDYWNGVLDDGSTILPGNYSFKISHEAYSENFQNIDVEFGA